MTHTVLLKNGTVGTVDDSTINYQPIENFIGQPITVHVNDENGNDTEQTGILESVEESREPWQL
jgi:hypothetical protein